MTRKRHATVPIFVPHKGCPQQCSFCDQRFISGICEAPSPSQAKEVVEKALGKLPERAKPAQIAFFGGSFTAVDRVYMVALLQSVQIYIDNTNFYGIRVSTRPDAINEEVLSILKDHRVTDIELGAQSMDDKVLKANRRGHTASDTKAAARLIKSQGFGLGLQMMTGLIHDSPEITVDTAKQIIRLNPDCVRIYPTVVLKGTELARLYSQGEYEPQSLEEAVSLCADLLELFDGADIPVIKLGLHDSPGLENNIVAGPFHPAFRELCESRVLMRKTLGQIREKRIPKGNIHIYVAPRSISVMTGQKRANINELTRLGYLPRIIPGEKMRYLEVKVTAEVD